jgi:hypothetical protein
MEYRRWSSELLHHVVFSYMPVFWRNILPLLSGVSVRRYMIYIRLLGGSGRGDWPMRDTR